MFLSQLKSTNLFYTISKLLGAKLMTFVNEFATQEDRDKYFSKYEILELYYPRDWIIDRERESILFLHYREREDMYSDELEHKYG